MIEARIVADSMAPCQKRLTTFVLTYPRFIHSEVLTHRQFSRNSASSRAIPVQKMIERIEREPAMPVYWGKNQKGMQASEELTGVEKKAAVGIWLEAAKYAVERSKNLLALGVHKQIANRLLEPFAHMTTIVSATEWGNFFNLRAHKDAQPEFQELAYQMLEVYVASRPVVLAADQWHLPFADKYIPDGLDTPSLLKIATARCARVSYLNFEGDIAFEKDYQLHDSLLASGHMSPFEHCGQAQDYPTHSGNFVGFVQYRKKIPGECRAHCKYETLLQERLQP